MVEYWYRPGTKTRAPKHEDEDDDDDDDDDDDILFLNEGQGPRCMRRAWAYTMT
jgi:hypothetical protein